MGTYKILLVDDEEDVRRAIIKKLDWAAVGYGEVREASNGIEAMEALEAFSPDVLVTDIQMPFMDGLELCRNARKALPGIRLVIFSGFDEFDYAQEAIKLGIVEYIMKPVDAKELSGILHRIAAALDAEAAERLDTERIMRRYEQSLPILRQQLLVQMLAGHAVQDDAWADVGLDLASEKYCVAVVKYKADVSGQGLQRDELRLRQYSLYEMVCEMFEGCFRCQAVFFPDHIAMLLLLSDKDSVRDTLPFLSRLIEPGLKILGLKLNIGVGNSCKHLPDVSFSYEEAVEILEYNRLQEDEKIIYIGDVVPGKKRQLSKSSVYIDEIQKCILRGDHAGVEAAIMGLSLFFEQHPPTRIQYDYFLFELGVELNRIIQIYDLDYDGQSDVMDRLILARKRSKEFSAQDLKGWILECAELIRSQISDRRKDNAQQLAQLAKEYVAEHYPDANLSLDRICKALSVSPSYFTLIFKNEAGKTFISYLTETRMQAAVDLLAHTDDKTYEVAVKVGYADPNYFSYAFKKNFGVSPTKYRAENLGHG